MLITLAHRQPKNREEMTFGAFRRCFVTPLSRKGRGRKQIRFIPTPIR